MWTDYPIKDAYCISISVLFLNCVHIGRNQTIAAIIRGHSKFLLENTS